MTEDRSCTKEKIVQGKTSWRLFYIGTGLVLLGLVMPALISMEDIGLYDTLLAAIYQEQEVYLLYAALKLVAVNAVRAYPHYLGVFFLVEFFESLRLRRRMIMSTIVVCVTIPGVYVLIDWIYKIHYDFGIPAISMIAVLVVLAKIDFSFVSIAKKTLLVAMLITALQFLDMMPLLWRFPFGRGEISYDIKLVSTFLGADQFLQALSTIFFVLLIFMTILLLMLIIDENNIRKISEQKELNEHMLMETRMRVLENRTYMELRHLVHDLKSPLTGIQALVGVVKLSCQGDEDKTRQNYLDKIEDSIDQMSQMISEILHEERRTVVTTQEVLDGVMAQISVTEYAERVVAENRAPEAEVEVNRIRFFRVLINLIENAAYAIDRADGRIEMIAEQDPDHQSVRFIVRDNGRGISRDLMNEIWKSGVSGHNSNGLGLSFVKQVVTQTGGTVELESEEHKGTVVTITLPVCEGDNDGAV